MSGFVHSRDRAFGLRVLIVLLALLLCVSYSLPSCSSRQMISIDESEPLAPFRYSESSGAVQQDITEFRTDLRLAVPFLPEVYTLCSGGEKDARHTPYRLSAKSDKPSCVIAANIGGHAPPVYPAFIGGNTGISRLIGINM